MSASLVGSEMCIRDSVCRLENTPGARSYDTGKARLQSGLATRAHWNAPVSYTHLTLPTICSV
eukprot:11924306-Alexandrium_andersonii.AAC.1